MRKNVREWRTKDPRALTLSDPLVDSAPLMQDDLVGSLPVVEDGRLVGIADSDITIRVAAEGEEKEKDTGGLVGAISEPAERERR
jgi:CBS domain-containing protein